MYNLGDTIIIPNSLTYEDICNILHETIYKGNVLIPTYWSKALYKMKGQVLTIVKIEHRMILGRGPYIVYNVTPNCGYVVPEIILNSSKNYYLDKINIF